MSVIDKIKEKGFRGCLHAVKCRIIKLYNIILSKKYQKLPIDENSIVLESEGDCCDNAYALFDYMKQNGYIGKYKITWLVDCPENFNQEENVKYIQKQIGENFSSETIKALRTCKWYIYDHCDLIKGKKRSEQKIIFLGHGCGFKAASSESKCFADEVYSVSPMFYRPVAVWCGCDEEKLVDIGYPRLDYFFKPLNDKQIVFKEKYKLNDYKKVFLWMPTFRRSINTSLDEGYFESKTGLPILYREEELDEFNNYLKKCGSLCIFKVHHLQAKLESFQKTYSNILLIEDEDLSRNGIQLYQFIMLTDCLITDYSSISTDYMLLNKPIIYTMDDYEEYKNSRGFSIEDPAQYFVGYHAYNKEQLFDAIEEVANGLDKYKEERNKLLPIMHTHIDGNASKRILDHLGIIK